METNGNKMRVYEVGLRDGLQNERVFVPTSEKIALAQLLVDAGVKHIELTSFVSPRWIPQLRDHVEVAAGAPRHPGVRYSALVPNLRGLEGALDAGLEEIGVFLSASESHSQRNINKSTSEALRTLSEVTHKAREAGRLVRGYVSVVFGCPIEGAVDPGRVHDLVLELVEMGVYQVSLGDTIGVAHPNQVRDMVHRLAQDVPLSKLGLHLHDTRGTALANVLAGLECGITTFDSAFGGLGGCPYAPGAAGNLATEDLVYMLNSMGYDSGVDLQKLIAASEHVAKLVGHQLSSKVFHAELASRLRNADRAVGNAT
jgi:hydroxymethylglutaryl-CoA lyase